LFYLGHIQILENNKPINDYGVPKSLMGDQRVSEKIFGIMLSK